MGSMGNQAFGLTRKEKTATSLEYRRILWREFHGMTRGTDGRQKGKRSGPVKKLRLGGDQMDWFSLL